MLLPYRVKNPVKRFPYATLTLIIINIIVYLFTTNNFGIIQEQIITRYGFAWGKTPFINAISSAFLHGDPFHIFGNMLFLWIFGSPVEDRLGIPKYLAVYLLAGFAGDALQTVLDLASAGSPRYAIGASGCIMGLLGAYWYLFSWSTVCVFYWLGWRWIGVTEVAAVWIIGLYLVMDTAKGIFFGTYGGSTGVAHFAHVGGAAAGILLCMALRVKRDSGALSEAKAVQAEVKDLSLMPLHALQTMLEEDPGNPELIRAMIQPALDLHQDGALEEAMVQAGPALIDKDPPLVAHYLTHLHGKATLYQPAHLLRLATHVERSGEIEQALAIYQLIPGRYPSHPDAEMALYRMASVYWDTLNDTEKSRACLREMARRFPKGPMMVFGRDLWNRIT